MHAVNGFALACMESLHKLNNKTDPNITHDHGWWVKTSLEKLVVIPSLRAELCMTCVMSRVSVHAHAARNVPLRVNNSTGNR